MSEIYQWVDKPLNVLSKDSLFSRYFDGINLEKIDDSYYLTNKLNGIGIVLSDKLLVTAIHLYSGKTGDIKSFKDELPLKLKFSLMRDDILEFLGKPKKTGGGHRSIYLGEVPVWDKFFFQEYSLHFQYWTRDNTIDMITITSLKLEEYFNSTLQ